MSYAVPYHIVRVSTVTRFHCLPWNLFWYSIDTCHVVNGRISIKRLNSELDSVVLPWSFVLRKVEPYGNSYSGRRGLYTFLSSCFVLLNDAAAVLELFINALRTAGRLNSYCRWFFPGVIRLSTDLVKVYLYQVT